MVSSVSNDLKLLLHEQGRLRVWSIIVTIMGDVVETTGGEISIAELIDICKLLDIEPQAVRTAMSRLGKEGWVDRIPDGRSAYYRFSDKRRDEFNEATQYIYANPDIANIDWNFGIMPPLNLIEKQMLLDEMTSAHPITVNNQIITWRKDLSGNIPKKINDLLTIFQTKPIQWGEKCIEQISPSPQQNLISALLQILNSLDPEVIEAQDALIVRVLMIHFWRRLVLRHPVVNSPFNEEVWPLPKLHKLVAKTYALISPKSEAALSRPVNEQMRNARFQF